MTTRTADVIFLFHVLSTLAMGGVIWFVQIVHYPLFDAVGVEQFSDYEQRHVHRTGMVVAPLMLLELFTACGLLVRPPSDASIPVVWVGLTLLAIIWISTFAVQVPLHTSLEGGFDLEKQQNLVRTNWWRTWLWTARCGIVLWMIWDLIGLRSRSI